MKFSEFIAQYSGFDSGNRNHGGMLVLPDQSYFVITEAPDAESYAAPAADATHVNIGHYVNPHGDEEECLAFQANVACSDLLAWIERQRQSRGIP